MEFIENITGAMKQNVLTVQSFSGDHGRRLPSLPSLYL